MQEKQPRDQKHEAVPVPNQRAKATWHRPTITFVSLQATASSVGSFTDGGSSTPSV